MTLDQDIEAVWDLVDDSPDMAALRAALDRIEARLREAEQEADAAGKMAAQLEGEHVALLERLREAEAERDEQRMEVARALAELQGVGLERNRYREVLEGFVAWERSDFSTSDELVRLFMLARSALEPKETERLYMLAPTPEAKAAYLRQQSGPTVDLYDTLEPKENTEFPVGTMGRTDGLTDDMGG